MNNPCEWCKSTSEQIDSLEHEIEDVLETNRIFKVREGENMEREFVLEQELEAKDKVIAELRANLKKAFNISVDAIEINMGNYTDDEVCQLNNEMIDLCGFLANALTTTDKG